ncbi:MAG: hypothetical protein ACKVP3_03255 [Hyphomicrobiaceae bacterium]
MMLLRLGFAQHSCAQAQVSSYSADLAFNLDCVAEETFAREKAIERFLREQGFRVMNVVRMRHERKLVPMPQELFIDGIDDKRRRVRFMAIPSTAGVYSVGFYTRPPTRREEALENEILALVTNTLKCSVREVSRNQNGSDKREAYDRYFEIIEDRFRATGKE